MADTQVESSEQEKNRCLNGVFETVKLHSSTRFNAEENNIENFVLFLSFLSFI